jgi:signal transduction histidine kinase
MLGNERSIFDGCSGCSQQSSARNRVGQRWRFLSLLVLFMIASGLWGREVKVGIYQNHPKIFISEDGNPAGIFVDILNHIADQEGWELSYHEGTWDENLLRLEEGKLDLIPDLAYAPQRAHRFDFHQTPVLFSWSQLYARKNLHLTNILDLEDLKVAVMQNSIQAATLNDMIVGFALNTELIPVSSFDEAMAMAREGGADVAATNSFYGRMNARKYNLEDTAIVFEPSSLFYATAKGKNPDLLQAIERHITEMKRTPSSVYYDSMRRWTSDSPELRIPQWLWILIAIISLVLLLSLMVGLVLQQQVRKRTQQLRQANQEMEIRIEERTEELAFALQQAQVADLLKSAFLATMSHELRTPLNSIIGFTGIMLQELPGKLNEEQTKMLGIVQNSSRHLLSLINDVLDISKIEAGQLDLHLQDADLEEMVEKSIGLVSMQANAKGIELKLDCAFKPRFIKVDKRRFEQVLLNLLSNAVKFTEAGSVSLICRDENGKLRITVKDTGIGIPKNQFDRLFLPFQQIDVGLTRKYEGTGLGLSISQKLIRLMGGEISVESEINKGSSFHIVLPLPQEGNR